MLTLYSKSHVFHFRLGSDIIPRHFLLDASIISSQSLRSSLFFAFLCQPYLFLTNQFIYLLYLPPKLSILLRVHLLHHFPFLCLPYFFPSNQFIYPFYSTPISFHSAALFSSSPYILSLLPNQSIYRQYSTAAPSHTISMFSPFPNTLNQSNCHFSSVSTHLRFLLPDFPSSRRLHPFALTHTPLLPYPVSLYPITERP